MPAAPESVEPTPEKFPWYQRTLLDPSRRAANILRDYAEQSADAGFDDLTRRFRNDAKEWPKRKLYHELTLPFMMVEYQPRASHWTAQCHPIRSLPVLYSALGQNVNGKLSIQWISLTSCRQKKRSSTRSCKTLLLLMILSRRRNRWRVPQYSHF